MCAAEFCSALKQRSSHFVLRRPRLRNLCSCPWSRGSALLPVTENSGMELPVVIRADDDDVDELVPEPVEPATHPPQLVPRKKVFVYGETLQPGSELREEKELKTDSSSTSAASASGLGSHVASLYRSLVQGRPTRKRSSSSSSGSVSESSTKQRIIDEAATAPTPSDSTAVSCETHLHSVTTTTTTVATTTAPVSHSDSSWFYCEWCAVKVHPDEAEEHLRSTVHRFNLQYRPSRGHYYLNETNVGYRMLKDMHWTEEVGLGAEGQGRLEPIATRLKNDKKGLGAEVQQPLRVTHTIEEMQQERERERRRKDEKRRGRAGKGRREQRALAAAERKEEARIREEIYASYTL